MLERKQQPSPPARDTAAPPSSPSGLSLGRLVPVVVLVLGLILFFAFDLGRYVSLEVLHDHRHRLVEWVDRSGLLACLVFAGVYALIAAFSVPVGAVATILGGFLFGPVLGSTLTVIGATAGATALFLAARYAFADYLRAKAGPALRRMEDGFNDNALSYLLFLRLIPVFPFWLVNLAPAFLGVRLGTYVFATAIGIVPGTVVYTLVGDGIGAVLDAGGNINLGIIFEPRFLAPIIGLGLLALMPIAYKKFRRAR